jgi:hypothetical protein
MSYSVMLNSNSDDALNLSKTRDLLRNLVDAYAVDNAKLAGLQFDINDIDKLARWSDKLVKLMNISGSLEDVILEPADLS